MRRWKVRYGYGGKPAKWWVFNTGSLVQCPFDTWREAMDYADEQARTITATLPRVSYGDHVVADKGIYSLHVDHREHCTDIYLGGWDGVTVENRHLMDLAVYLAACAHHREAL